MVYEPRIRQIITPVNAPPQLEANQTGAAQAQDAALQTQLRNLQQSRQFAQQSNADISTMIGGMADNLAQARQARGVERASRHIREEGGNTLGAFADLTNTALEVWGRVEENRIQRQAAADEARIQENEQRQLQNLTFVNRDHQQLLANAESALRNPAVGTTGYQQEVTRFLQSIRPLVSEEDLIRMTTELYAPMRDVMTEQARSYFGTFSEIYNTEANLVQENYRIQFGGQLAAIAREVDPSRAQDMVNTMLGELQGLITSSELSPIQRQQVLLGLLTDLEDVYGVSTEQTLDLQRNLSNMESYIRDYQLNVLPLQQNGQFAEANTVDLRLRIRYGISGDTPFTDPFFNESELNRSRTIRSQGRELAQAELIDARRLHQLDRAEVLAFALQFYADPTQVTVWQNTRGFDENPYIQQAIELAESVRAYEQWQSSERPNQILGIQQQITDIDTQILNLQRQYIQGAGSNDPSAVLQTLGLLSTMNDSALDFFSREGQGREFQRIQQSQAATMNQISQMMQSGRASPEQVRDATIQVIESLQRSQQLLREEAEIIQNGRQDLTSTMQQWGLSSVEDFQTQSATAGETYQGIVNEILEIQRQVQEAYTPAMPNFNLPELDQYTYGEIQAIVPFRLGAVANIQAAHDPNSGQRFGDDRGTHIHAGVDFGIPIGTEIVSYLDGVVERVTNDANGYGQYIVIRSSQDGTRHLFAHMSDIPWESGQHVRPGDLIGLSGNTGRGTGPHLHWQIMRAGTNTFGYDVSINPFEYTSALSQYSYATNPTATSVERSRGGRVRLVNNYSPSDLNSYREGQGYGNNGEANWGYAPIAQNNALRSGIHRVAQEMNIPGQWLADVMAYETGGTFSSNVWNYGGAPAVGLIQFYPDAGSNGQYKTIRGRRYMMSEIAAMDVPQQMNLVRDFLVEMEPSGGYNSVWELLMTIWGGGEGLRQLRRDPAAAMNRTDGDITFGEYSLRLGSHAGRRYVPVLGSPAIHTRIVPGCPICAQMTPETFVQHEAQ